MTNFVKDQINVTALCKKFRIETSDVSILTTLNQKPTEESRARFKQLIEPFRVRSETSSKIVDQEDQPPEGSTNPNPILNENDIDDDCVEKFAKKTNRQLRINELIREHSQKVCYGYNYNFQVINGGASFQWSFRPNSARGSIELIGV